VRSIYTKVQRRAFRQELRGMRVSMTLTPDAKGWRVRYTGSRTVGRVRYTSVGKARTDQPDMFLAAFGEYFLAELHSHLMKMISAPTKSEGGAA
jgi:hypothetical protein